MRRLLIAATLLLVVVAVTYIKSARGTDQRREAFDQGMDASNQQLAMLQEDVDSLKELLRLQEDSFSDSLARRDGSYRDEISRLVGYLDSAVARPESKPKTQAKQPPAKKPKSKPEPVVKQATEEKPAAAKGSEKVVEPEPEPVKPVESIRQSEAEAADSSLRENVLTFYGKLYEALPKDLTSQERKVALYEISIKTAAEYSITMPQLKVICENYYLSY